MLSHYQPCISTREGYCGRRRHCNTCFLAIICRQNQVVAIQDSTKQNQDVALSKTAHHKLLQPYCRRKSARPEFVENLSYLLMQVVRELLPSLKGSVRINIDATRRGNVARFINHRLDPRQLVFTPRTQSEHLLMQSQFHDPTSPVPGESHLPQSPYATWLENCMRG